MPLSEEEAARLRSTLSQLAACSLTVESTTTQEQQVEEPVAPPSPIAGPSTLSRPAAKAEEIGDLSAKRFQGVFFLDCNGKAQAASDGIHITRDSDHAHYADVRFLACTFRTPSPTVFENCFLDDVTFINCCFKGSVFRNFYAKAMRVVDCTFDDCSYINQQRPDDARLSGQHLVGRRIIRGELPAQLAARLSKHTPKCEPSAIPHDEAQHKESSTEAGGVALPPHRARPPQEYTPTISQPPVPDKPVHEVAPPPAALATKFVSFDWDADPTTRE